MDCLFCKMLNKEIEADIVYENDQLIVISDINPQAPIHKLIIPKKHIETINHIDEEDTLLLGQMIHTAKEVAGEYDVAEKGYRLIFNTNLQAGQSVFHIHLHLLGGRPLLWPPG